MEILTIIEENRPGLLAEITTLLASAGVDVRGIDGDTAGNQAVITLRAEPYRRCHRTLADAGFKVFTADHLLVRIKDQPGALATLSQRLANEQIDIRSIHFIQEIHGECIVALETASPFRASQVLQDILVQGVNHRGERGEPG